MVEFRCFARPSQGEGRTEIARSKKLLKKSRPLLCDLDKCTPVVFLGSFRSVFIKSSFSASEEPSGETFRG